MFGIFDWFKRRRARKQPFVEAWREILKKDVPFYPKLGPTARARFEDKFKVFLLTKQFLPAGGMELEEQHRVIISAAAARLTMNLPGQDYQRLTEIIVYPSAYKHAGAPEGTVIFGEAHTWGTVVLSYDAVIQGMMNTGDGHNTAMHEFAHVLDIADGKFDGTPVLEKMAAYGPWMKVMSRAFLKLRGKDAARKKSVLRKYGATNEAEFFAVATETFFEKPRQLKAKDPELYDLLVDYFKIDPIAEEDVSAAQAAM